MKREIVMARVSSIGDRLCMALYEDDKLMEIRIANDCGDENNSTNITPEIGDIYIGRVEKVVPSIHAAFIEIAPGVSCYYPLKEADTAIFTKKIGKKPLCEGEELIVQVQKEAIKSKQASVTSNINFKGVYTVLTTGNTTLGVSSKISKGKREELQDALRPLLNEQFGIIARTNASNAQVSEVLSEIEGLSTHVNDLIQKAKTRTCFTLLQKNSFSYITFIDDFCNQGIDKITIEDNEIYHYVTEFIRSNKPELLEYLSSYHDDSYPLEKLYSLETRINEALGKKVWLKSGGFLIIEHTEALTVIDVNSGKSISKKNPEESYLKLNLEAAKEISRQLRLRNISGIIVVDFINMKSKAANQEILECLKKEVIRDRVPTQILGMTKLYLMEITRKKTYKSLWESINKI